MSNNINQDRLHYLQNYFDNQLVKVEVPVYKSETTKGTVHYYFNDSRYGYQFNHGIAWVEREDLYRFRNQPQFIIHDKEGEK
ncbi:hypothetical protein ACE198_14685 [Neobacillus sp. KR4-4]|uniref:hypothetical protein n=1 Tax=Neobacillus sp. KR4-4 TaxID=3344872 RepID=UPI0035CC6366